MLVGIDNSLLEYFVFIVLNLDILAADYLVTTWQLSCLGKNCIIRKVIDAGTAVAVYVAKIRKTCGRVYFGCCKTAVFGLLAIYVEPHALKQRAVHCLFNE